MGKLGGFLEYERVDPAERSVRERVRDWHEFGLYLPEDDLRIQAARCMDCGTPFCHTGVLIGGMASGCPLNNLIPEWNDLVYRGLWREAFQRLLQTNDFPEVTGRVCPAPCEGSCVVGINDPPVTIKAIECAIINRAWEEGWVVPRPPAKRTGKRVAVVGSGPAGLAAAARLNSAGHSVTVFERADLPGGLLMYGIPNMKLDKELVLRRIKLLEAEGVQFVCNTEIGRDYPAPKLLKEYHAVILATGATRPRDLPIEGRQLAGIHFAMEFLTAATRRIMGRSASNDTLSAAGKDVVVIGGGDTGTDCVATAIRQGCKSVVQLEILPKPAPARLPSNPWPEWPRVYKLDYGHEEASELYGADPRVFESTATKFEGDETGRVKAVHAVRVRWEKDANNRPVPKPIPGTERVLPAQMVLLALGFLGPEQSLLDALRVGRDNRSNVTTADGSYATNIPGVFACGDCRRGQSLVVWALREGRDAARECHRYLMGNV
ncbi:MAG: glutamate synthase subunit beta [Verrucomicrobiae bacterium]|nr:glutamate synthase subunit beta [Verrucomicrobiae bacterium]